MTRKHNQKWWEERARLQRKNQRRNKRRQASRDAAEQSHGRQLTNRELFEWRRRHQPKVAADPPSDSTAV
jgi:hypothetical protein